MFCLGVAYVRDDRQTQRGGVQLLRRRAPADPTVWDRGGIQVQ